SKANASSTAANAPTRSGDSGPWTPLWPESAAPPGPGGKGEGGCRCGVGPALVSGVARAPGPPRPSRRVWAKRWSTTLVGTRATRFSVLVGTVERKRSELAERLARRARCLAGRRCALPVLAAWLEAPGDAGTVL